MQNADPDSASGPVASPCADDSGLQSGHHLCRKAQFSVACFGSLFAIGAIGSMREIYVLKFGADITTMGIVGFVVAFWSALCDPVSGYLQDTSVGWYAWLLPVQTWGKRAPWVAVHLVGLWIALVAAYFPPSGAYEFWYLWVMILAAWCFSTINTAFASSLFSLYKFKKERAVAEGFGYIAKTFGIMIGFAFFVVTLANASFAVRGVQALVCTLFFVMCLVSIPVYREVRQEAGTTIMSSSEVCTTLKNLFTKNSAFYVLSTAYAFDGARTALTTFIPFYLTYVAKVSVDARSFWIASMILEVLVVKVSIVVALQCLMTRHPNFDLQKIDVACQIVCGISSLAIFLWSRSAVAMVIFVFIREAFKTPHLFWGVLAQTWVIDEDVAAEGKSREGFLIGIVYMSYQLSGAVFGAVTYIGLGLAGLEVADCSKHEDGSTHYDECYKADQDSQPDAVEDYIVYLFASAYTLLSLLMALAIYMFPINGGRLQELELAKQQRLRHKAPSATTEPAQTTVPAFAIAPSPCAVNVTLGNSKQSIDEMP